VRDERKRPIRGLWARNGRYYAQLAMEDLETGPKRVRRVSFGGDRHPGAGQSPT
jgi:hypothetical protein